MHKLLYSSHGTNDNLDDNLLHDSYQFPIHARRLLAEINKFIYVLSVRVI